VYSRGPRLKNRDGGLGRIHRSIPVENNDNGHPFRYDVDFVLGGRISKVERSELVYTTADAEGMTERRKRDRNPSTVVKEAEETKQVVKMPAPKKKKATGGKGTKGGTTKKKTVKKAKGSAGTKHKTKNGKAGGKKAATKQKAAEEAKDDETIVVKDLYERHKRDFEKCLARLEKQDTYAFFLGDPPPECDEHYESSDNDNADAEAPPSTPKQPTVFPDTPPFNFTVIRKRMAHGRYVLDRVRQQKERSFSLSRTAPALLHPKGVHWDQFRDDVVQMCDAAIARDPDGADGGRGTLGHAANKTKTVSLRVCVRRVVEFG
jgi:hypothetical protein